MTTREIFAATKNSQCVLGTDNMVKVVTNELPQRFNCPSGSMKGSGRTVGHWGNRFRDITHAAIEVRTSVFLAVMVMEITWLSEN